MFTIKRSILAASTLGALTFAACSGGGGGGGTPGYAATAAPTATPGPVATATATPGASTAQVVSLALPSTAIGREQDPTFGAIAGFTQTQYSQVLAFAPGSQIMIHNGQSGVPHTLGDLGTSSFPSSQPSALSTTGTGTTTLSSGWQSGTISPGATIGPITLAAGTYYIGCAYHYQSDGMRDVLEVAAAATPGPQATQAPGGPTPVPTSTAGGSGGYGY